MGLDNRDGSKLRIGEETRHEGGCAKELSAVKLTCAGCW